MLWPEGLATSDNHHPSSEEYDGRQDSNRRGGFVAEYRHERVLPSKATEVNECGNNINGDEKQKNKYLKNELRNSACGLENDSSTARNPTTCQLIRYVV